MTDDHPREPISPYTFRVSELYEQGFRPKPNDVRALQDAFDALRESKRIIQHQRDELDAENDKLRDEVERLTALLAANGE